MSYLRGPLTREEISRLMSGRPARRGRAATRAEAGAPPRAVRPSCRRRFRHNYFPKYGGELADPHLLVKYAVRYKGADETVGVRA